MINIQNAPNVPDPQGFSQLGQILNNPNAFNDLTGLNQNQLNALETANANVNAAQNYAQMASSLSKFAGEYDLKKRQQLLNNKDKILDIIKNSKMSDAEKGSYTQKLLEGLVGSSNEKTGAKDFLAQVFSGENKGKVVKANYSGDGENASLEMESGSENSSNTLFSPERISALAELAKANPEIAQQILGILNGSSTPDAISALIDELVASAESLV